MHLFVNPLFAVGLINKELQLLKKVGVTDLCSLLVWYLIPFTCGAI